MSTQTLDLTELLANWDANPACEAAGHPIEADLHEGDAVWRAQMAAPCCKQRFPRLYCDKFKQWMITSLNGSIRCPFCNLITRAILWHASAVWNPL